MCVVCVGGAESNCLLLLEDGGRLTEYDDVSVAEIWGPAKGGQHCRPRPPFKPPCISLSNYHLYSVSIIQFINSQTL